MPWRDECFYGILQSKYSSPHSGSTFTMISKNYRKHGYLDNEAFSSIKQRNDGINWHKKMQAITHAYIQPKIKDVVWRLIVGKLYMATNAHSFLNQIDREEW